MFAVLVFGVQALSQERGTVPLPDAFVIGRHTFIDVGPPFDFFELFVVRSNASGSSIEKILLAPPGNACLQPATVQTASAFIQDSIPSLLGPGNPCTIPEKELRRELKRCKKCLVFSGEDIAMLVECGARARIIRSEILDKDLFDKNPNTPKHTSQTMQLLARLDHALGPGPLDKPIFQVPEEKPAKLPDSTETQALSSGKYDSLFTNTKLSDLYQAARNHPPAPTVSLVASAPIQPTTFIPPDYPQMARIANIEGDVVVRFEISPTGAPTDLAFESGHPILRAAVNDAMTKWVFPANTPDRHAKVTLAFKLNCSTPPR